MKNRFQRSRDCDLFSVCFFCNLQRLDSLLSHIRSCYLQLDHLGINYFKEFMQLRNNVLSQSVIFFFHHYSPFDNEKSFNVDVSLPLICSPFHTRWLSSFGARRE